jgi:uncharacterized BrkB/YihY/UPF0761 family membrane protein
MDTIQSKGDRLSGMEKGNNRIYNQKSRLDFYQLFVGIVILCFIILLPALASAQGSSEYQIEMADAMRANGKIYVVVLVIGIVFAGLFIFAIRTDSKVSKLEKEVKNMKISEES